MQDWWVIFIFWFVVLLINVPTVVAWVRLSRKVLDTDVKVENVKEARNIELEAKIDGLRKIVQSLCPHDKAQEYYLRISPAREYYTRKCGVCGYSFVFPTVEEFQASKDAWEKVQRRSK
jgi:hypothetical protein